MNKKDNDEELTVETKEQRQVKVQASFEKAVERNGKALEKLSDNNKKS